jgi:hypothetical protein
LHQKATYRRQFRLDHYLRIAKKTSGGNYLEIVPLSISIGAGFVLEFANGSVTVSANYNPGEERIDVNNFSFPIDRCERVRIAPIDLTAHTFESRIRTDYEGTILNEIDVSAPAPGLLQIEIDWQETALIPANIKINDIPKNAQNSQQFRLASCNSQPSPYVWQLFAQLGTDLQRFLEGRVLVTADV